MSAKAKKKTEISDYHKYEDWHEGLEAFKKERNEFSEKLRIAREERWQRNIPKATAICLRTLSRIHPCLLGDFHFEHVDAVGYWFEYQLVDDSRHQTYCVRHVEVK